MPDLMTRPQKMISPDPKGRIIQIGAFLLPLLLWSASAMADSHLSILVTSNLQGKFSLDVANQEVSDPLLLLGQDIVSERSRGLDLYLDMGNALYPGILSKYSSGAVMMDFLDNFGCQALLVSSRDLQIGTQNLEFLAKSKKVRLLSSNIIQKGRPVFTPWFAVERQGIRVAFLGVSSEKVRFYTAEKDLYGVGLAAAKDNLKPFIDDIRAAGIRHIVLLSGMGLKDTAAILDAFPEIDLAICGGDDTGRYFQGQASRLDLADGRSVVAANEAVDYYILRLAAINDRLNLQAWEPKKVVRIPTGDYYYQEFKSRLTLWKEKFRADQASLVAGLSGTEYQVDDLRFAQLLRDRFDCELGVVETGTINPLPVRGQLKRSDFLNMVNRDYNLFVFSLTGDQVRALQNQKESLVIAGFDTDKAAAIQGLPIENARRYRVAATGPAMEAIQALSGKQIAYRNTWLTVSDLLTDDLTNERVVLRGDYDYLDRRFRTTIDAYLANFVENSTVDKGDNIQTPPGQPSQSYNRWGLENKIDITFYNKYHRFVFTPYMLYSRQEDTYLNNILRGTLLYDYNLGGHIKPYGRLQCDTVVEEVDDQRPVLLRGTVGASAEYENFNAKLGLGFEKQVQDPSSAALYGIELILGARFPFLSHFTYAFDLNTFGGIQNEDGTQRQIRSEINNSLSAAINDHLSLSFRHKYFYVYEDVTGETYRHSQFITSLDLTNAWKFW